MTTKMTTKPKPYDYLDKVLKRISSQIFRIFREYRQQSFDELHAVAQMREMYDELLELNLKAFRAIAEHYYQQESGEAWMMRQVWLERILRTPSKVMKCSYDSECVRKRDHLVEALLATSGSVAEFDKAMRYWAQLTGWFAVEVADAAIVQSMKDHKVERAVWRSEYDNKVCERCWKMNGKVYRLGDVPPKPHPNCRCWIERVEG